MKKDNIIMELYYNEILWLVKYIMKEIYNKKII